MRLRKSVLVVPGLDATMRQALARKQTKAVSAHDLRAFTVLAIAHPAIGCWQALSRRRVSMGVITSAFS